MKTPPFLLAAALLFWGWQTWFLIEGAIMAVVLESSRFIKARWELADDDFARIREAGGKIEEASWIRERPPF